MQPFPRMLTGLAFVAHALLGCWTHHACDRCAAGGRTGADRVSHHCAADHQHDSHKPTDDRELPSHNCQHVVCSFVKAESVAIDRHDAPSGWRAFAVTRSDIAAAVALSFVAMKPRATVDAPHLYVWHCALLI